jgi:DNA-binding transcriptional ArsR family regulator
MKRIYNMGFNRKFLHNSRIWINVSKTLTKERSTRDKGNDTDFEFNNEVKPKLISTEKYNEVILELFGKKYIKRILCLTSKKEYTAIELSLELKIPLATVYRKIKLLEEKDMIEVSKMKINLSGNEEKYYRCLIDDATIIFHDGKISVNIKMLDHIKKIVRQWEILRKKEY